MPKQSTKHKNPNPSGRNPLATKPLPQAESTTVSPAPTTTEEPTPQAILTRLLNGSDPRTRQEAFLLIRWQRLAKAQRQALAFEWDLPVDQKEDKGLAEQAKGGA